MANAFVLQNSPVETRLMALEDAMETGARALFGEKYGDEVRVVSMGFGEGGRPADSGQPRKVNKAWSVELCGGTHVKRTGDIGLIKITGESASAAGVRRIEALTAEGARAHLAHQDQRVRELAGLLRTKPDEVVERVKALVEERRQLERSLADAKRQLALGGAASANGATRSEGGVEAAVNGVKMFIRTVEGLNPKDLRSLVDEGKKQVGSGVVVIAGVTAEGKANLAVGVTSDMTSANNAVELVRIGAEALGGKGGGGRPDFAQAGGPDGSKAKAAIEAIKASVRSG